MEARCRLCLSSVIEGVDIFASTELFVQLKNLLQLELENTPTLPTMACPLCTQMLAELNTFREDILAAQEKLGLEMNPLEDECEEEEDTEMKVSDYTDILSTTEFIQTDEEEEEEPLEEILIKPEIPKEEVVPKAPKKRPAKKASTRPEPRSVKQRKLSRGRSRRAQDPEESLEESRPISGRSRRKKKMPEEHVHLENMMREMNLLTCPICLTEVNSVSELIRHHTVAHNCKSRSSISCCGRKYKGHRDAYDHMRYHLDKERFRCQECGKVFLCGREVENHLALHAPPEDCAYTCETCGQSFKKSHQLKNHSKSHLPQSEREFPCEFCEKKFNSTTAMKVHCRKVHATENAVVCELCGKGMKCWDALRAHMAWHAKGESTKCDECGKHVHHIELHKMRMHSVLQMVECELCHKSYTEANIKNHMRLTHRNKEFFCTVCDKKFTLAHSLKVHMDIHLGVKYSCYFCEHLSTSIANRAKHHQQKHPEKYAEYKQGLHKEVKRRA